MKTQLIVDTQTLEILSVHTGKGSQHDFKLFKTHLKYKVKDEKLKRLRYGVQVNSLGLTETQPENKVYRILSL